MAFTMANMKKKNAILPTIHSTPSGSPGIGDSQPPKNSSEIRAHMRKTAIYSPAMNKRYGVDEYSTMNPATSSDSASGRSNGGRLVSARAEMKNSTNIGNKRGENTYQPRISGPCARTMSERFKEPANSRTVIKMKPIETSYETIWAA